MQGTTKYILVPCLIFMVFFEVLLICLEYSIKC